MNKIGAWIAGAVFVFVVVAGVILVSAITKDDSMNQPTAAEDALGQSGSESSQQQSTSNSVTIRNYEFTPSKVTVKKGTTVTWTNDDGVKHDIRPVNETDEFKASQLLGKGESYSVTIDTVGTYDYICSPHPYMKGTVEVVE